MKKISKGLWLVCASSLFILLACDKNIESSVVAEKKQMDIDIMGAEKLSPTTRMELSEARSATAKYHDIAVAIEDGYMDIGLYLPYMGHHYLKGPVDNVFDHQAPEILVYQKHPVTGKMKLVAVEYISAHEDENNQPLPPPEGFTGDDDIWVLYQGVGPWALHAWIWYDNPDGVFNGMNAKLPQ